MIKTLFLIVFVKKFQHQNIPVLLTENTGLINLNRYHTLRLPTPINFRLNNDYLFNK